MLNGVRIRNKGVKDVSSKIKDSKSDKRFGYVVNTILVIVLLLSAYPIIYVISSSLSSPDAVTSGKVWLWPVDFSLEGYKAVFENNKVVIGYANTIFYTLVGTTFNVLMTIAAAYPLSRKDMPGRNFFMFMFAFTMIFSGGLIPNYLLNQSLGLINTRWVMIIPGAIGVWNLIITRTYFESTIPAEVHEAAKIDGCNDLEFLFKIVLPLSKPIIAVLVLFYAVGHWNAFFDAFIYLKDADKMPLQVVLRDILIMNQVDPSAIVDSSTAAAKTGLTDLLKYSLIIVASLPIWCVYPFIQKYFVKGIMVGAIKG